MTPLPGTNVAVDRRIALLLGALVLVIFGAVVATDTAQPASRYSLTAALAEHGSIDIGPYKSELGIDRAIYQGELRSDKAPGQPLLAVPVYLVGRAFGAQSASHTHVRGDLGLWWNSLWSATIPFAILVGLMYLACARFARRNVALAVTASFAFCTMMLPHAVNLYAHDLAALFGFAAWLVIEPSPVSARHAVVGGLLAGAAMLSEYDAGIILLVLAIYVLVRDLRRLPWFALGAAVPLAALAGYQWAAFGAPWHTPASYYAGVINGTSEGGYTIPGLHGLGAVFFGARGLIIGAPIALVALAGAGWVAWKGDGAARRHAIVGLAVAGAYVLLCAGWSGLPTLEEPGPRYLIPALPFLAVPLAVAWERIWRPAMLAAVFGALVAVPAAFTSILVVTRRQPFTEDLRRVRRGEFQPTVWSMGLGRVGVVLYAATVVVVILSFVRYVRRNSAPEAAEPVFVSAAQGRQ